MNYLKILGKSLLYMTSILFISTLIITLLNYFNIFGSKIVTVFKIIIVLISMFVGGFIMGKNSNKKGWLEGLKLGLIILVILILVNFILKQSFDIRNLIYYLILIASTVFGSMIGINKKIEEK